MLSQSRQSIPIAIGGSNFGVATQKQQQLLHTRQQMWGGASTSLPGSWVPRASNAASRAGAMPTMSSVSQVSGMLQQQHQSWMPISLACTLGPTSLAGSLQLTPNPVTSTSLVGDNEAGSGFFTTAGAYDRQNRATSPGVYGPGDYLLPSLAWIDIDLALDVGQRSFPSDLFGGLDSVDNVAAGATTSQPPAAVGAPPCTDVRVPPATGLPAYAVSMPDVDADGCMLDYTGDGSQYLRGSENSLAGNVSDDFLDLDFELPASFGVTDHLPSGSSTASASPSSSSSLTACTGHNPTMMHSSHAVLSTAAAAAAAAPPQVSLVTGAPGQCRGLPVKATAGLFDASTTAAAAAAAIRSLNDSSNGHRVGVAARSSTSKSSNDTAGSSHLASASFGVSVTAPTPGSALERADLTVTAAAAVAVAPSTLGKGIPLRQGGHASAVPLAGPQLQVTSPHRPVGQASCHSSAAPAAAAASSADIHMIGDSSATDAYDMSPQHPAMSAHYESLSMVCGAAPSPMPPSSLTSGRDDASDAATTAPLADVVKLQRMQATEEILRSSGLLDATMLTGRVTARQRVIQFEIQKLKRAMHEFMMSIVCEEPEAKRHRYRR